MILCRTSFRFTGDSGRRRTWCKAARAVGSRAPHHHLYAVPFTSCTPRVTRRLRVRDGDSLYCRPHVFSCTCNRRGPARRMGGVALVDMGNPCYPQLRVYGEVQLDFHIQSIFNGSCPGGACWTLKTARGNSTGSRVQQWRGRRVRDCMANIPTRQVQYIEVVRGATSTGMAPTIRPFLQRVARAEAFRSSTTSPFACFLMYSLRRCIHTMGKMIQRGTGSVRRLIGT